VPKPPALVSPLLASAMSHPTRVHALAILYERAASPREIAAELDEPVNNVTYHVKQLVELGCIELVETRPAHGGRVVEHFYRAIQRLYFDDEDWERLGTSERRTVDTAILRMISDDVNQAVAHGTFSDPDDNHLSRTPITVDREGWEEIKDILGTALNELIAVSDKVASRAAPSEETVQAMVGILHFRSAPSPKRR
jgi:DNA-binding MarR family transcriptional regulator